MSLAAGPSNLSPDERSVMLRRHVSTVSASSEMS